MRTHKPTKTMRKNAARGLELLGERKNVQIDPDTVMLAKQIHAGNDLTDSHVKAIHERHKSAPRVKDWAKRGSETAGYVLNRLMGGDSGATWSANKTATMSATFSEDRQQAVELFGAPLTGELLSTDGDYIWAPVLRSGELAMRPKPGGGKIDKPLRIVAGHSDDQRSAIGLQDLLDAFDEGARQDVGIIEGKHPADEREATILNTGFIRALRIADSKLRPGEKVLMAAHDFTEPDVKAKVQRGTYSNRSPGILYDYAAQESGKVYAAVLDHVAITNRPFVTGMEPYGATLGEGVEVDVDSFVLVESVPDVEVGSDDESNAAYEEALAELTAKTRGDLKDSDFALPGRKYPIQDLAHAKNALARVAQHGTDDEKKKVRAAVYKRYPQLKSGSESMTEGEELVEVVWDATSSAQWVQSQISSVLREMRKNTGYDSYYPSYFVRDVDTAAKKALVQCDYGDGEDTDAWVVPYDISADGDDVVLSSFDQWVEAEQAWITDPDAATDTDDDPSTNLDPPPTEEMTDLTPLQRASRNRLHLSEQRQTTPIGGKHMLTREQVAKLDLTDDVRADMIATIEKAEKVDEIQRDGEVAAKVTALRPQMEHMPGLLAEIEAIYRSDDGDTALMLSEQSPSGAKTRTPLTATQVVDRIIAAMPIKDGKIALSEQGSLLESPLQTRPPNETEGAENLSDSEVADKMLEWAAQHDPRAAALVGADTKKES